MKKVSTYLNLNKNIQINAGYYYKKIIKNEEKVVNNITLIAFCLFYAVREEYHNAPFTIKEIAQGFVDMGHRVNPRLMLRDGLVYKRHLNTNTAHHKSEDYLSRLLNAVINHKLLEKRLEKKQSPLSKEEYLNKLTLMCRNILRNFNTWKRGGRNPFILAGSIIYLADRLLAKKLGGKAVLTQTLISEATTIPEYSIRDHYVNLLKPIFINELM